MRTERVEKTTYLFLKKHDQSDGTHADQLIENSPQEPHFEHLTHEKPYQYEHHHADEDVQRTAFFHQFIKVVEDKRNQNNVDGIF